MSKMACPSWKFDELVRSEVQCLVIFDLTYCKVQWEPSELSCVFDHLCICSC